MVSFFFPMWASETAFYSTFSTPDLVFSPFASPVEELMADFTIATVPHQHVGGCCSLLRAPAKRGAHRVAPNPSCFPSGFIFFYFFLAPSVFDLVPSEGEGQLWNTRATLASKKMEGERFP